MKWRMLAWIAIAECLGMALWFSASAVVDPISAEWELTASGRAWLTMSVQAGFVAGTLLSAFLNLADVWNARHLFAVSALLGATFNGLIAIVAEGIGVALILRFLTGVALAGLYPPGMKIMASWFREGRGMAIGVLVGALTLGSASPHLLRFLGSPEWRDLVLTASIAAVAAGLICFAFVGDGPHGTSGARFNARYALSAFANREVRLANFGYLGHMWELYAVWTWIPLFLAVSFTQYGHKDAAALAALAGFAVIGIGAVGCVVAGLLADRYGRTTLTIISLVVSGACCVTAGFVFGAVPLYVIAFCLVWGFVIVADSAQFSASITELADPNYVGTALTIQTCLGFLLTLLSIRIIPSLVEWVTWQWAFAFLAVGPAIGAWSMFRLGRTPAFPRPISRSVF